MLGVALEERHELLGAEFVRPFRGEKVGRVGADQYVAGLHRCGDLARPVVSGLNAFLVAEPDLAAQAAAGAIFRKNARDELPEAVVLAIGEQARQQRAADARAPRVAGDVDGELGHLVVAGAGAVGGGPGEADHPAVPLGDHRWMAGVEAAQHLLDVGGRARLGLEGGDPVGDPFRVDAGDGAREADR